MKYNSIENPENFFHIKQSALLKKKENIFIPICLGNKFFVNKTNITNNVKLYIEWALEHTNERVLILIADKIQDTNYFVRSGNSSLSACRIRVLKDGLKIKNEILDLIKSNFSKYIDVIDVINYEEYQKNDPHNYEVTNTLYKEFKNNPDFSRAVIETVKTTQSDRNFTKQEYLKLSDYILDEFSLVYVGVEYKGTYYGLYIYPQVDSTVYFIKNIQDGNLFQSLTKQLPKRQVSLITLNDSKSLPTSSTFYNNLAYSYEEMINSPEVAQTLHQNINEILAKYAISKGDILDVGCGPGNLKTSIRKRMTTKMKMSFTGIDMSSKMLNIAQQKGYKVIHGNFVEILPTLPDNSYDYIIALSSLHFTSDIESILKDFERVAKKGYIISLDEITDKYKNGFATVCSSPVYNHYDTKIINTKEDFNFIGWKSPRENTNIRVRMIYKEFDALP